MKIVIDIPEDLYNMTRTNAIPIPTGSYYYDKHLIRMAGFICAATAAGTPLPKGHDRLIYAEDVKQNHRRWLGYLDEDMIGRLNTAIDKHVPTIIESDRDSLEWLGKNCKDCGNEKCKNLGILPKEYDCALWQAKQEDNEDDENE